jgi:glycosyltransferase involved in cell wall biosynthesis
MTQRKIRVVHIVNNLNYGGMERLVAELVRRTNPERFDLHVLALGYIGHFGEGLDNLAALYVADPMPSWSMLYPRGLARQLARICPDVAHLHSGVLYKASLAASMAGVPYQIYTDHGRQSPDPWTHRMIDKRAAHRVDAIVAVSDRLKQHLISFMPDASRISVIPNGVDTEHYIPREDDCDFRSEIGIASDVPVIGSVGRLEPIKGYGVMIEAFRRLHAGWTMSPKPVLVLVGDGSERSVLEQSASRLGVADYIHFVGWRSDIERITRAFTLFSMSSHSEGTSVSLLEAMSSGLCPVVTNVGGNAAVLGAGLQHRLVGASDPDALALALSTGLLDRALRERDAIAARGRVVQEFGLDAMVGKYEALYNSSTGPIKQRGVGLGSR